MSQNEKVETVMESRLLTDDIGIILRFNTVHNKLVGFVCDKYTTYSNEILACVS